MELHYKHTARIRHDPMTEANQEPGGSFVQTLIRVFTAQAVVMLFLWLLHSLYN